MALPTPEAYMSLALAYATGVAASADFERAMVVLAEGKKFALKDADASVLFIGVSLTFVDAIASMQQDEKGFAYDFKPTPLRNAADFLLSGEHVAALAGFHKLHESGRALPAAVGLAATYWVMGDKSAARDWARKALTAVPEKQGAPRASLNIFLNT